MDELPHLVDHLNWPPGLLLPIAFGGGGYALLRMAAEQFAPVAKALGPIGRRWTAARESRMAKAAREVTLTKQVADLTAECDRRGVTIEEQAREIAWLRRMRDSDAYTQELMRQVDGLTTALDRERERRELTDAYLNYDVDWHRTADIAWRSSEDRNSILTEVPAHMSLMAFGRQWRADRARQARDASG